METTAFTNHLQRIIALGQERCQETIGHQEMLTRATAIGEEIDALVCDLGAEEAKAPIGALCKAISRQFDRAGDLPEIVEALIVSTALLCATQVPSGLYFIEPAKAFLVAVREAALLFASKNPESEQQFSAAIRSTLDKLLHVAAEYHDQETIAWCRTYVEEF